MLPMVPQHWYIQIILKLKRSGRIQDVTIDYEGGYESRWKIEFGFEYFTGNHERRHLEEGISISFACTVYMD